MEEVRLDGGVIVPGGAPELCVLVRGEVDLAGGSCLVVALVPGGYWGEESVTGTAPALYEARAVGACTWFTIPADLLAGIPLVQWTLMETLERRLRSFRAGFRFEWEEAFRVDNPELDDQHQRLFALVNGLSVLIAESGTIGGHESAKQALLDYTRFHFQSEEGWLSRGHYPRLEVHAREHRALVARLEAFVQAGERRTRPRAETMLDYLKDWLIRHTLLEDLKYAGFLSRTGAG
jgi:hemerythrin